MGLPTLSLKTKEHFPQVALIMGISKAALLSLWKESQIIQQDKFWGEGEMRRMLETSLIQTFSISSPLKALFHSCFSYWQALSCLLGERLSEGPEMGRSPY